MAEDLKVIVRDNVRRLLRLAESESGVSKLIRLGLSNGNAQRILSGETSIGVDVLAQLAYVLGVLPWQLCVPDLDPDRLPGIEKPEFRWPFRQIDAEVITSLVGSPAADVERGLLVALAAVGISPRKPATRAA